MTVDVRSTYKFAKTASPTNQRHLNPTPTEPHFRLSMPAIGEWMRRWKTSASDPAMMRLRKGCSTDRAPNMQFVQHSLPTAPIIVMMMICDDVGGDSILAFGG